MTTSKHGVRLIVLAMLALFVVCATLPAGATTYYVRTDGSDSNDGSANDALHAWATINDAGRALQPGDTVLVEPGTYFGVPVLSVCSGTADNKITYKADGPGVILTCEAGTALTLTGVNYIVIDGFEFGQCGNGIDLLNSASYITVRSCYFHPVGVLGGAPYFWINMLTSDGANVNAGCSIENNVFRGSYYLKPIWAIATKYDTNLHVYNNIFDGTHWAIDVEFGTGTLIKNNIFVNIVQYGIAGWPDATQVLTDHNLYFNNANNDNGFLTRGAGELFANPLFAGGNAPTYPNPVVPFDYSLSACSPAINAGVGVSLPFVGTAPDIGPFESAYTGAECKIVGTVTDGSTSAPLAGATVSLLGTGLTQITGADGKYSFCGLTAGTYTVKVVCPGATDAQAVVSPITSEIKVQNFVMVFLPRTYYVKTTGSDAQDGLSLASAWKTIGHGDSANILNPGDTVLIEPGVYSSVSLTNKSGLLGKPITYKADGAGAQIVGADAGEAGIAIAGSMSHLAIHGLEISHVGVGVNILGADNITVTKCYLHDLISGDGAGIRIAGGATNQTVGCMVDHNIITNDQFGVGIIGNASNTRVYNNTFDSGSVALYGPGDDGPSTGTVFVNNIVASQSWDAIVMMTAGDTVANSYNLYFNNAAPSGVGEIAADPLFVGGTAPESYKLTVPTSPALESGTAVGLSYAGLAPDRGAYESEYVYPGAIYHVKPAAAGGLDTNDGKTLATAWASIDNGDARSLLRAGDTILVEPGEYRSAGTTVANLRYCFGNAGAPITYKANGLGVNLRCDTASTTLGLIEIYPTLSWTVIDGFDISGPGMGIDLYGADHVTIQNCAIHDYDATGRYGISITSRDGSNSDPVIGMIVRNNVVANLTGGQGIVSNGGTIDTQIYNNTLVGLLGGIYGPRWQGPDVNTRIQNNILFNITYGLGMSGTAQINDHNLFFNIPGGHWVATGPTDILSDPLFAGGATHFGFDLLNFSPAIDRGAVIYTGQPFSGTAPDIGAFESLYTRPTFPSATSLPDIKKAANDTPVGTDALVVTGVFGNTFYLEQTNRACGIRVDKDPAGIWGIDTVAVGQQVQVAGKVKTDASSEKYILADQIRSAGSGSVAPLASTNKALIGKGLSTNGLLVTTTGKVTETGSGYFVIDDGSGIGVKVLSSVLPSVNSQMSVTGDSSCWMDGATVKPMIRMTDMGTAIPTFGFTTKNGGHQIWMRASDFTTRSKDGGVGNFVSDPLAAAGSLSGAGLTFQRDTLSDSATQLDWWAQYDISQSAVPFPLTGTWTFWSRVTQSANNAADSNWLIVNGDANGINPAVSNPTNAQWLAAVPVATQNNANKISNNIGSGCADYGSPAGLFDYRFGWWSGNGGAPATFTTATFNLIDGKVSFRIYEREACPTDVITDLICWSDVAYTPSDADALSAVGW